MSQSLKRMVCDKRISYRASRSQIATDISVRSFFLSPPLLDHCRGVTLYLQPPQSHLNCSQQHISCLFSDHSDVFCSSMTHSVLFFISSLSLLFHTCISYMLFPLCFEYQHMCINNSLSACIQIYTSVYTQPSQKYRLGMQE